MKHSVMRGVTEAHKLLRHGVNCTLSTNNVLNPFTPFGDCSLVRMANIYANICQVGSAHDTRECFNMITTRSAKLMNLDDYGLTVGKPADLAVLDAESPEQAVAELPGALRLQARLPHRDAGARHSAPTKLRAGGRRSAPAPIRPPRRFARRSTAASCRCPGGRRSTARAAGH